ncbi:MAG: hypothetical protein MK130_10155 [Puniceicoccaceae bacterium]|nr:hypothetical protein [Puniceicoccaceae bacterium]
MPTQSYIEAHELYAAYQAVCLSGAGIAELKTLSFYDVDPTEDDAEERIIEIIEDECAHEQADFQRKVAA